MLPQMGICGIHVDMCWTDVKCTMHYVKDRDDGDLQADG